MPTELNAHGGFGGIPLFPERHAQEIFEMSFRKASAMDSDIKVMLDSGAFSAWYHGEPIELAAYLDYIAEHGAYFNSIVALDVIPGSTNRKASVSAADVEAAARQSAINHAKMRKAGVEAIPVFHQGENWNWLEGMLDDEVPYIGLSPSPRAKTDSITHWLDECFTRCTDAQGWPICKTHGFGATTSSIIRRYPWFSVDSTTWAVAAGYGAIIMPRFGMDHAPDFSRPSLRFHITDRDDGASNSLLNMQGVARKLIEARIEAIGLTISDLRASTDNRAMLNARFFVDLQRSMTPKPFAFRKASMPKGYRQRSQRARLERFSPTVLFADQIAKTAHGRALLRAGGNHRLISYYAIRKYKGDAAIKGYTKDGYWVSPAKRLGKKPWSESYIVKRRLALLARLSSREDEYGETN